MEVKRIIICWILVSLFFLEVSSQRKNGGKRRKPVKSGGERRNGRQKGRTTVVSCRVFNKGVCKKTSKNIILVNKSIANSAKCQQFCYATPECAAFTHFDKSKDEDKKCVLFRDCNGHLSDCRSCISGPIMPRITECLAARQEVAPEIQQPTDKPGCSGVCTSVCVGPKCPELLGNVTSQDKSQNEPSDNVNIIPNEQSDIDTRNDDADEDYFSTDDIFDDEYDEYNDVYEAGDVYDEDINDDYYGDSEDTPEDSFDYTEEDDFFVDNSLDLPLDEAGIDDDEEEVEEVDVNIDDGFLSDSEGKTAVLPTVETRSNMAVTPLTGAGNTFIFFFCALGGANHDGSVNIVDMINTGLGNAAQTLSISPLPSEAIQGDTSSAYTNGVITTCSQGFTILSPYGFIYKPGNCFDYNLQASKWQSTGARLTSFRKGATITKLGRYLIATGGYRKKKPIRSVELFDPKRPKSGWKKVEKLRMPVGVSDHCTVAFKGRNGKEIIVTGGKGREKRVMKLDIKTQKWYSLNRLTVGRKKHACTKADINGRPGLVVSGGSNRANTNVTSVEFYDAKSGAWYSLPPMRKGRQGHVMTVTNGKIMVAGGERIGRSGREFLDDIEMFNGKRWVASRQKLDRPRSNFSLVKIPKKKDRTNPRKLQKKRKN